MGFTKTLEETSGDTRQAPAEPGDHEKFSHYVEAEKIADATIFGTPVTALCGKRWVPTRDPERFPVCPRCKEIFDALEP